MSAEAVFTLAAALIAEHGDEKAFDETHEQVNLHLAAEDFRAAETWILAAKMINEMLSGSPH